MNPTQPGLPLASLAAPLPEDMRELELLNRVLPGPVPTLDWAASCLAAFVAIAATTALRLALDPWLGNQAIPVFFIVPIAALAYCAGLRGGFLATLLACLAIAFFLAEPRQSFQIGTQSHAWQVAILAIAGLLLSCSFEILRRAHFRLLLLTREHRAMAKSLARENDSLAAAQAVARMGSWELDLVTMRVTWSAEIHRIFGTDPGVFRPTYASFLDRVAAEDRGVVDGALQESLGDLAPHELQHRIVTVSGEVRHVIERWQARAGCVVGTCQDITNRVERRRELQESEQRYRDLFESSPFPLWVYDAESLRFILVNDAAIRLYGYDPEEFYTMCAPDIRLDGDAMSVRNAAADMVPRRYYQRRSRHQTKAGKVMEVEGISHVALHRGRKVVVSFVFDVTEREREQREREVLDEKLRAVGRRLVTLQEEERRALATELHDRVGQSLSVLGIQLSMLGAALVKPESQRLVGEAKSILDETGEAVRGVIRELRPEGLHEFGLVAALRNLAATMERRTGISILVTAAEGATRIPGRVEIAWFRICQEALSNVAKHARASAITVTLRQTGRTTLWIADDGVGFTPSMVDAPGRSGWGLLMMRERAEAVGARLRIRSRPGNTHIVLMWKDLRSAR